MPGVNSPTDSHVVSDLFKRHLLGFTGVLLDRTQEYLSPLFSSLPQDIKPNSHPSCLSALSLVARLLKRFKPTIHLDECTCWILYWYTVCPRERFTGATWLWELCSSRQMATVSQDQPPGLLFHVPSWLAAVVLPLNNLTVSYDRSQELCKPWELLLGVSVYFPSAGISTCGWGLQTRLFHDENHCHT